MPRGNKDSLGLFRVTKDHGKFSFKYKDASGKWKTKATGKDDLSEAYAVKLEFEQRLKEPALHTSRVSQPAPQPNPMQSMTLKEAAERWRQLQEANGKQRATLKHEQLSI